jgi:hypothetical protein
MNIFAVSILKNQFQSRSLTNVLSKDVVTSLIKSLYLLSLD